MQKSLIINYRQPKFMERLPAWRRAFSGVRPRLLVWYFLLTVCTAVVSLEATRQVFCQSLQQRSQAALAQQVEQFKLMVEKQREQGDRGTTSLASLFDRLMASYAPLRNEYVLMFINGQFYRASPGLPAQLIDPQTLQSWKQNQQAKRGQVRLSNQQLINYAVEPVTLDGSTGSIIAVYNASADFQAIERSLAIVNKMALAALALGLVLAWIATGRVLEPLKLLTKTAQSITERDMTQRITVQGKDEIAELGATFNEMLDRLQLAFDSQKEFIKDASHELRTPITIIQGHLETLKYSPAHQQEQTIALLMDELDRMGRLVNDLLILAKADHPDFLHAKPEELDWLTEELFLKARSLTCRNWQLESKGLSPIWVDRQRLTQAMMNLVQNAIRHTQAGDTITLGSAVKQNQAFLWVRDTGAGIAPEDQTRIFERFARATPQDPSFEGHGLGLAIVSAIVHAHGGWVELESRPGFGSTFTLVLPLTPSNTDHASDSHSRRQSSHQRLSGDWLAGERVQYHSSEHGK